MPSHPDCSLFLIANEKNTSLHETPLYLNVKVLPLLNRAFSVSTKACGLCGDIFMHFNHLHLDRILPFGRERERKKINKGKMDDRRQNVEEGDTSKRRSFCRG